MDVTTSAFSFTQVILAWTLLGLLLTWLITFSILALRSFFTKKAEWEDTLTLSGAFPALMSFQVDHLLHYTTSTDHTPFQEAPNHVAVPIANQPETMTDL